MSDVGAWTLMLALEQELMGSRLNIPGNRRCKWPDSTQMGNVGLKSAQWVHPNLHYLFAACFGRVARRGNKDPRHLATGLVLTLVL